MDLEHFRNVVILEVQHAEERLMNSWYPKVIGMFSGEGKIVEYIHKDSLESFYECVSTLLGNQMRYSVHVLHVQLSTTGFFSFLRVGEFTCPSLSEYVPYTLCTCTCTMMYTCRCTVQYLSILPIFTAFTMYCTCILL